MSQLPELTRMRMQFELIPESGRRHQAADLSQFTGSIQLEQRYLGADTCFGQKLESALQQKEHGTRPGVFGEKIDQGLLFEARLQYGAVRVKPADAVGKGQHRSTRAT